VGPARQLPRATEDAAPRSVAMVGWAGDVGLVRARGKERKGERELGSGCSGGGLAAR
jgi:hypothetical protein